MGRVDLTTTQVTSKATTRVAYIRTLLDTRPSEEYYQSDWVNLRTWLWLWVGQRLPIDLLGDDRMKRTPPPPDLDHHYILGYSTAADSFILSWLLEVSELGNANLSRCDFDVYLSDSQMNDPKNKDILTRLISENVTIKRVKKPSTEYASDYVCDSVMLSESDYILDPTLMLGPSDWMTTDASYQDSLRHGHPQRYKPKDINNGRYGNRLKDKMGHTIPSCSYPYGKSEAWKHGHEVRWSAYACPCCGRRCKRSKGCKETGIDWAVMNSDNRWIEGLDLSAARPPDFERNWRNLSAEDVVNYCGPDTKVWERFGKWKWRSVDTFSGDWKRE